MKIGNIIYSVKGVGLLAADFTLMLHSPIIQISMLTAKTMVVVLLVALLALMVRLPGLSSFMTVDEENWMLRSGQYYHKVFREGDIGAFMTTHPGATAMWIAGAGIVWQEARLGFDVDTSNLIYFRKVATFPIAVVVSVLIGVATLFLARLLGLFPGVIGGILLALEPYLVGMSQIAHLDMLLALFMLNSVLAFLLNQKLKTKNQSPNLKLQIISGIFAGLALATKLLLGLWLFVFFAIFLVWQYRLRVREIARQFGLVFGAAMLTFFITWPAALAVPDFQTGGIVHDARTVIRDEHVAIEASDEPIAPAGFYVRTLLGRTTPFVLILAVGAAVAAVRVAIQQRRIPLAIWLMLYGVGFLILITIAAKKADRYALPALVTLPVVAGWGLAKGFEVFSRSSATKFFARLALRLQQAKPPTPTRKKFVAFGSVMIFVLLLAQILLWVPHSIAYNSLLFPNIRPLSQQGWGEGLEEAAKWLNQHPVAEELYVASWYPGVMQTYFHGKTFSLSSRDDNRVSYVVLYRNMYGRGQDTIASDVIDEYRGKQPDHIVLINGTPYAWVYATSSTEIYKQHAGELVGQLTVGQLVPVEEDNWQAIEIGMANFSNRANTQDVILHVREGLETTEDIRTVRVNASDIADGAFHRFEFEPIMGAAGKTYYVFLDSPTSRPGDAVTVRFVNEDISPGEMVKNGVVLPGRDVAYRVP